MKIDLKTLPFSRRGSYLVISELNENWNGCGNEPGLYLRTVHSSAQLPLVARIDLRESGKPMEYEAEICDAALRLANGSGRFECCFDDPKTMLIRDTVRRFADMVQRSGFAENFDAITGEGLRDRSYTWTASAFLVMCHEFL